VQQRYNLVRNRIALMFHLGYFRHPAVDELPGIEHFLQGLGSFNNILRAFFKKFEEFLLFGYKRQPYHGSYSFTGNNGTRWIPGFAGSDTWGNDTLSRQG